MSKLTRDELIKAALPLSDKLSEAANKAGVELTKIDQRPENLDVSATHAVAMELLKIRGLD
jgi:hypothetical protein